MSLFLSEPQARKLPKPLLLICVPTNSTCDTCFEFISTPILGEWHLAALQSKEGDWETRCKVTPACVITLGRYFVCSICPPKALSSPLVKIPNKMALLNLCQLMNISRVKGPAWQWTYRIYNCIVWWGDSTCTITCMLVV